MRIGFMVRDVRFQRPMYTTIHLANAALARGWEVYLFGVGDLTISMPGRITRAKAVRLDPGLDPSLQCHRLLEGALPSPTIDLTGLDLLFPRFKPVIGQAGIPSWEVFWTAMQTLARLEASGVAVVNSSQGLLELLTKAHLAELPNGVGLSEGLVTRSQAELDAWWRTNHPGEALVIKPMAGSGGEGVFLLSPDDLANRDQLLEVTFSKGYALIQPYYEQGAEGDKRVLLLDGEVLEAEGRPAVYRRKGKAGRLRNNMHAGGSRNPDGLTSLEAAVLARLGPWLVDRGLRFVGVDLLGEMVLEINGFCPGGIHNMKALYGYDLAGVVLDGLTRGLARLAPSDPGGHGAGGRVGSS